MIKTNYNFYKNQLLKSEMRIFQDIFNDEEVLSDSYKIDLLYDDVIAEVKSKMIIKKDADVDIGCGNAFGGNNEGQEGEAGKAGEAAVAKVIDLIDAFRYQQTSFDLEGFKSYFREYMKKLLTWLQKNKPERVQAFKTGAKEFFKWAGTQKNFDQLTFYTGQQYDMQNLIVMSYYKNEEDEAPTFIYVMDGLKSYKV